MAQVTLREYFDGVFGDEEFFGVFNDTSPEEESHHRYVREVSLDEVAVWDGFVENLDPLSTSSADVVYDGDTNAYYVLVGKERRGPASSTKGNRIFLVRVSGGPQDLGEALFLLPKKLRRMRRVGHFD